LRDDLGVDQDDEVVLVLADGQVDDDDPLADADLRTMSSSI
jgi:hypothetical protein